MTKKIRLVGKNGEGKFAIVDDINYEYLNQFRWYFHDCGYACRGMYINPKQTKQIRMHREILNFPNSQIDHINGNKLDNRMDNLRICNRFQNSGNRGKNKNNTSGYKGVRKYHHRYISKIQVKGKTIHLGLFDTPEMAAKAYDSASKLYFGDFAFTNFD